MKVTQLQLPGVLLVEPRVFADTRGHVGETWSAERYAAAGMREPFVQDNLSRSRRGVLRGLHLQHPGAQAKLVYVLAGEVFDVAVDVRRGSPTFGRWVGTTLSAENHLQLYVPRGFAHGFVVMSEEALVGYKCSAYYAPAAELGIRWNDASIGISWPVERPVLAPRDAEAPLLGDLAPDQLPAYVP